MADREYHVQTHSYGGDGQLDIEGEVVGILNARPSSQRVTLLVALPATDDDSAGDPERVTIEEGEYVNPDELDYRELQDLAKKHDIKANQSKDDLTDALTGTEIPE